MSIFLTQSGVGGLQQPWVVKSTATSGVFCSQLKTDGWAVQTPEGGRLLAEAVK